jgi:hypothetical protein
VWLAAVGLFFDVAVRRISLDPTKAVAAAQRLWAVLRHADGSRRQTEVMDRLMTRKERVGKTFGRPQPRTFEADLPAPPVGPAPEAKAPPAQPPAGAPKRADKEAEGDYAGRLQRAKKRAWKDQDPNKGGAV